MTQPNYISPHFQKVHYPSSSIRDFRAAEGLNGGQIGDPVELVNVTETEYQYKFQGQERQDELGLNWDSFKWRNYDYAIKRFFNEIGRASCRERDEWYVFAVTLDII